jgi:hypothetical protein
MHGEFGALAGDKGSSLPGTKNPADFGKSTYSLPKVRTNYGKFNIRLLAVMCGLKKMV